MATNFVIDIEMKTGHFGNKLEIVPKLNFCSKHMVHFQRDCKKRKMIFWLERMWYSTHWRWTETLPQNGLSLVESKVLQNLKWVQLIKFRFVKWIYWPVFKGFERFLIKNGIQNNNLDLIDKTTLQGTRSCDF